mmetsp:Transcript_42647/g.83423  ORF Transcript_42647/g.83423 Transcript_42647/m.83423 type:complete len:115 (+) Transcript_42647:148-492(+)
MSVTENPEDPKADFFSCIIMQPGTVLTWHMQHLEKHGEVVERIKKRLEDEKHGDWLRRWDVDRPIFLTDENHWWGVDRPIKLKEETKNETKTYFRLNPGNFTHSLVLGKWRLPL